MTYFPDLSLYAYGHDSHTGVVHLGWLDSIHPYPKGAVDARLIEKVKFLASSIAACTAANCALNRRILFKHCCPTG
jgi:hypothetical protein